MKKKPIDFSTLAQWLAYCERLHPASIDMGLSRVREVARRMQLHMAVPVVTVAGTNGKGSTCAMLESIYTQAGWRTGVYTSPHLLRFEERCRICGEMVASRDLLPHFSAVEAARIQRGEEISLTYFEFTTLAILHALSQAPVDVVILEVGLGGRLDATNIVDADVAIITSIGVDHQEYLGTGRETIGFEKAGIIRAGRPAIVGDPHPPQRVLDHAMETGADLWKLGRDFSYTVDTQQWNWRGRSTQYVGLAWPALRGKNQLLNAAAVLAAIEALRQPLPVSAQAVRTGLARAQLPGRFQVIAGQPTLVLDVAHNPHAAAVLAGNLDAMGFYPRTHGVFGAMADKDIEGILQWMQPLVDHWYFCDLPLPRAAHAQQLQEKWQVIAANVQTPPAEAATSCHAGPVPALHAALAAAAPADRIVVFGSFHTVGGVLEAGLPALQSRHLQTGPQ